jgi:DNA gyrase/topoisomerase IV subunit A
MYDELNLYLCLGQVSCFDNEGGDGDSNGDNADNNNDADAGGGNNSGGNDGGDSGGDKAKTFSQTEVNRIVEERLARDRKKNEETKANEYRELEGRYTELLDNQNLSEEERTKTVDRLENVRKQLRTKDEDAKHEAKKVQDIHETELTDIKAKAELWEKRFYDSSIERALQDAAVAHDSYNANQVVTLLRPYTKLTPQVDVAGKETGAFETVIDFPDHDDKGVEVITQRTPKDTVKRMKELPDYQNLFKSNVVSGVGANSATGGISPGVNGLVDVSTLTAEQYAHLRKTNPASLGL